MSVTKTMELIEQTRHTIDVKYDMRLHNIIDIHENSNDEFTMICNAFKFGYAQGVKAAKAKLKK